MLFVTDPVQVDPPDVQGRTEILKVHAKDSALSFAFTCPAK